MKLETPGKIRELQRGLYFKAKKEPKFRFYLLQDKVWRELRTYGLMRGERTSVGG